MKGAERGRCVYQEDQLTHHTVLGRNPILLPALVVPLRHPILAASARQLSPLSCCTAVEYATFTGLYACDICHILRLCDAAEFSGTSTTIGAAACGICGTVGAGDWCWWLEC